MKIRLAIKFKEKTLFSQIFSKEELVDEGLATPAIFLMDTAHFEEYILSDVIDLWSEQFEGNYEILE